MSGIFSFTPLALMSLLIFVMTLTACGGKRSREDASIDAQRQVRSIVTDSQRAERLVAQIQHWDALIAAKQKTDADYLRHRDVLNSDYDATPETFRVLQARQATVTNEQFAQFLAVRSAIIADTTPDEWSKLSSARDELRGTSATSEGAKP